MQYATTEKDLACFGPFDGNEKIKDESERIYGIVEASRYNIEMYAAQIGEDPTTAVERFRASLVPA